MAETKPTGAKKHITGARIAQEIKQYKKDALISPLYTVCCVILEILIHISPRPSSTRASPWETWRTSRRSAH